MSAPFFKLFIFLIICFVSNSYGRKKPSEVLLKWVNNPMTQTILDEPEFINNMLGSHNFYRVNHKATPLRLSNRLSQLALANAMRMAKQGLKAHELDDEKMSSSEEIAISEETDIDRDQIRKNKFNILNAVFPYKIGGNEVAKIWYKEIDKYNFDDHKLSKETQHFTQMVWKFTFICGFGMAYGNNKTYVSALYSPPGNKNEKKNKNNPKNNVSPPNKNSNKKVNAKLPILDKLKLNIKPKIKKPEQPDDEPDQPADAAEDDMFN